MMQPCAVWRVLVLSALALVPLVAATVSAANRPILLPTPKRVTWLDGRLPIADAQKATACFLGAAADARQIAAGIAQVNECLRKRKCRALPKAATLAAADKSHVIIWAGTRAQLPQLAKLLGRQHALPAEMSVPDGYVLRCVKVGQRDAVLCIGHDPRGCYYALCTLAQLLGHHGAGASIPRVDIVDWPTYRVRLVKVSATKDDPDQAVELARFLPRFKINVYGLQYHPEKNGTWREPSERYRRVIEKCGEAAKHDAVLETAMFLCPFFRPQIDLTKKDEIQLYIDRFRWGLARGCKWIEIDFNDWGTWAKLSAAEKARFDGPGNFMASLTNTVYRAVRRDSPRVGVIACTTPSYYRGPAKAELVRFCRSVPEDILVYWTGPVTRSRRITRQQIVEWTRKTGRKPFLWDNTIYAHLQPYRVGYAFNPYFNKFPDDLPELLDGPGIHLNASARPHYLPGIATFADYLWNPNAYNPSKSIRNALELVWGKKAPDAAQEVQDRLLALSKWLYAAERGQEPFDPAQAGRMLDALEKATRHLADVAGDPALAADLEAQFLARARREVKAFKPKREFKPHRKAKARSLADGTVNPSVEEIVRGKPVGWSLYTGAGQARMIVSPEAHSGEHSLCLHATKWYHNPTHVTHGDRKWINVALIHGSEQRGYEGWDAYDVEAGKQYRCTFFLKGDVPRVRVQLQGWSIAMRQDSRRAAEGAPLEIQPGKDWKRYSATFRTSLGTKKAALKFAIIGYQDEGMRLGKFWVDDVSIEPVK